MKHLRFMTIAAMLVAAGCSGGSGDNAPAESTAAPPETSTPLQSIVRVVATGSFVSPDFGVLDSVAGSGTAFIVDESGLAVTNNHVVAGAASIEVFFGDSNTPVAASVVGRSECSDLAVIDLAGSGYPVLNWAARAGSVGTEVRAAGYPNGEPNLSLTRGLIARVEDDGATPWASMPALVRHDAELAPGNSGGPLLDSTGAVLGVNVAASSLGDFAIPVDVAEPIIDVIRTGEDMDSIGLNAVAVVDDITNESGVWAVSVQPGSLAMAAGLEPGDLITRMNGIRVGKDATLSDYCSVIRSSGGNELPIEVTRGDSLLAGTLGGAELAPVLEVTDDIVATVSSPPPAVVAAPPMGIPYESFDTVADDSGQISFDVPTAWSDRRTAAVENFGLRPSIAAAPDFAALDAAAGTTYDQPGVAAIVFSADVDINEALDVMVKTSPWAYDCTPLASESFEDTVYVGAFQAFMDCAGTPSTVVTIAVRRIAEPGWLLINMFAPTIADLDAALRIASTYEFEPNGAELQAPTETAPPVSALPETVAVASVIVTSDDLIAAVGLPPQAGELTSMDRSGALLTLTYPSLAPTADLRAWMDQRANELSCASQRKSESAEGAFEMYTVSCDFVNDSLDVTYTMRIFTDATSADVEISVLDWSVGG